MVKCTLEEGETFNSLKDLLSISLGLEVCIILLLIYSLIMLIFISISKKELALDWTSKIAFGDKIKHLILKFQKTCPCPRAGDGPRGGRFNIIYLYISIFISLIFAIFNAGFIQVILYTLTNI